MADDAAWFIQIGDTVMVAIKAVVCTECGQLINLRRRWQTWLLNTKYMNMALVMSRFDPNHTPAHSTHTYS
jgi:hypothetical protein